jgi:glycosyltransferase involved in cell wall biosynthesis
MSLISIIVPTYNNAPSLPDLLQKFQDLASKNTTDKFEFIFVDDGSFDDSFSTLVGLARVESRLRIVKLSRTLAQTLLCWLA